MVKCVDCSKLKFTGPDPEYTLEWWGHDCDADESEISRFVSEEYGGVTEEMINQERECPHFDQFKCFRCKKLLVHSYEVEYEEDICDDCAKVVYTEMAKESGFI